MIIGLSMKEREQIAIFDRLKKKEITQAGAAKALGVTTRWVRKKMKRYLEHTVIWPGPFEIETGQVPSVGQRKKELLP